MTTHNKLVKLEGVSYFIGKCRAGDYFVYSWKASDSTGYCGAELTFLCDDGYEKEVKSPYLMGYDWRDFKALVSHLKMPEVNQKAFKVTVGTKVEKRISAGVSHDDFGEIVYKDDEFVVGSVTDRIRKKWYYVVMYIKDIDSFRLQLIQYLKDNKLVLHGKNIGLPFFLYSNSGYYLVESGQLSSFRMGIPCFTLKFSILFQPFKNSFWHIVATAFNTVGPLSECFAMMKKMDFNKISVALTTSR